MIQPREARLFNVSDVRVSTVDKHTNEGEQAVRLCNYVDVYKNEVILNDFDFMPATCTPDEIARFRLAPGDVVFTKDSETADDIGIPAFVETSAPDLVCGYHVAIATPRPALVDPKFLFWYLNSRPAFAWWETRASGVTRVGLRQEDIRHLPLGALPPMSHQRAIADFLDRETAQIDAMIDAQEQMLNRVREREEAQTEYWIAEATANQPLVALKHVVDAQPGFAFPSADFGPEREGARLLRGVNIKPSRLDWSDTARWDLPESAAGNHYLLEEGDVVFGMDRPFISEGTRVALIDASSAGSLLVQRVLRLRARRGDSRLVYWLLRSPRLVAHLEPDFTGISVPHVSEAQVLSFLVPSISAETQHTLADRIAIQHEQHMALVVEAERVISLLRERRAALITAAVRGRIDPTTGIERIDPSTEKEAS